MGCELPDAELYRPSGSSSYSGSPVPPGLHGGLAYTPQSLRRIFSGLTEVESRRMRGEPPESPRFGEPFLWTALFRRAA